MEKERKTVSAKGMLEGQSTFLSLEYGFAVGSMLVALMASVATIDTLFKMWTSSSSTSSVFDLVQSVAATNYVGTLTTAIAAVLFALLSWVLFGRVSRTVQQSRTAYTGRVAYKALTYTGFSVLVAVLLLMVVTLVGQLVASLVLIGDTGVSIGDLYLKQFLPTLIGGLLVAGVAYLFFRIVQGSNKSRLLSYLLLGLSAVLLIATVITTAIVSHDGGSNSTDERVPTNYFDDYDWSDL